MANPIPRLPPVTNARLSCITSITVLHLQLQAKNILGYCLLPVFSHIKHSSSSPSELGGGEGKG
ncbi:hypothetical protein, partial [Nostoc linckia]|uniref:hypothetical protein n=1 Tax=Nostoc linckia TaxID=92942 RepID=UPI001C5580CC